VNRTVKIISSSRSAASDRSVSDVEIFHRLAKTLVPHREFSYSFRAILKGLPQSIKEQEVELHDSQRPGPGLASSGEEVRLNGPRLTHRTKSISRKE
jgi:hypothetical protein